VLTTESFRGTKCRAHFTVQIRWQAKHHPSGKGLVRLFTSMLTKLEVVVNGFPKGLFYFFNALSLESEVAAIKMSASLINSPRR